MIVNSLGVIRLGHLQALGLEKDYFFIILFALGLIVAYKIIHPFIQWLVTLKLEKLLSYMVSSLFIFNAVCLVIISRPDLLDSIVLAVQMVLQILALFGISLVIYYSVRKLFGKRKI